MSGPVLVTGAAGFVGSHLLDLLRERQVGVIAWKRPGSTPLNESDATWQDVELLDRAAVTAALRAAPPTAVYHLAGAAHVAQSWQYVRETYEDNVLATQNLFEGLRANSLTPRVLVSCSAHVYAPQPRPIREDDELQPGSPYATSKLAAEMLARHAWHVDRLPVLIARAFNHFGPRQSPTFVTSSIARQIALIEAGRLEPTLTLGNLASKRDLTDVRDTVRAYVAMVEHAEPGRPYNVASGRGVAIGDVVNIFTTRARCDVQVTQDASLFRPNDVPLLVGDRRQLSEATGWEPQIPLEETIADLLEYWRAAVAREP